jgi:hypothetical protein
MKGCIIDDVVYVIVASGSVTTQMKNYMKLSFNTDTDNLKTSTAGDQLLKFKSGDTAAETVFEGQVWYCKKEILVEMAKAAWT